MRLAKTIHDFLLLALKLTRLAVTLTYLHDLLLNDTVFMLASRSPFLKHQPANFLFDFGVLSVDCHTLLLQLAHFSLLLLLFELRNLGPLSFDHGHLVDLD